MVDMQEGPGYPEYEAILEEARRRSRGFVTPADVRPGGRYDQVANRRGDDWCIAVLGRSALFAGRWTHLEAELLVVADERNVNPPLDRQSKRLNSSHVAQSGL